MSNWDYVSSKLGSIQSATESIAKEIYDAAQAAGHDIWFMWGMGSSKEHSTGRALDLMVSSKAEGDWIRNYIWRNRKRLRLRHVIWWQRITSTVTQPGVVRKMSDRGNVTANHKDHIHVLFNAGSYQAPAQQTSSSFTPARVVQNIQEAVEVTVDGKWGPNTDRRVLLMRRVAWAKVGYPGNQNFDFDVNTAQRVIDTKVDGIWGLNSQAALEAWVKDFQKIIDVRSDGAWGPKTDAKLLTLRRRHRGRY